MKTHLRILCLFIFLSFQNGLFAHTVIVKGTVKDSSNFSLANVAVKIYSTDSSSNGCLIAHTVYTNPNGYYIDTLKCSGDIRKLMIVVINCNGQRIIHDPAVTSTGVVESNFVICSNPNTVIRPNCKAVFAFHIIDSSVQFNSKESYATYFPGTAADSIISRTWYFGDSSAPLTGNRIDPIHIYKKTGIYNVVLVIKTKSGCESKYNLYVQLYVPIIPTNCRAYFSSIIKDSIVQFNSIESLASSGTQTSADSIISRAWYFMDNYPNTATLSGNKIDPIYTYSRPGTYHVYLVIKTKNGCESKFTATINIKTATPPANCKAFFNFTVQDGVVKFNSNDSKAAGTADSIISRYWVFGETSNTINAVLQGNIVDPTHGYARPGKYYATLYIKSRSGCESRYTDTIIISKVNCNATAAFTTERISPKKIAFNSEFSKIENGDSIIQRNWKFGDNSFLSGNKINPVKEYPTFGIYTACLQIKTLYGCVAETCKQVIVQDSLNNPNIPNDFIKIMAINPNPVVTHMRATIYSSSNNLETEVAIYDIYGIFKSSIKKVLSKGNNIVEIETVSLYHGPYFLRVLSKNGKDSKIFYKL